jgi:hypothetical protein
MDTRDIPANDPEQQWIAKYRKAMNAAANPVHQARGSTIRDAIASACALLTSKVGNFLEHWVHLGRARPTAVEVGVANIQKLPIPPDRIRQASSGLGARTHAS